MRLNLELRRLFRRVFRYCGFERRIAPDFVEVMHANNIDMVIDVGANDGDFGREIRDRGYKGCIISFEPNPAAFKRLLAATDKDSKWFAHQCGVGQFDGEATLSVALNDAMSSFKGLTNFGETTGAQQTDSVTVKVLRLDTFFAEHPDLLRRTYVKIDTQGFELEVLRGAGDMLKRMLVVQAEIALIHTYAGEQDWLSTIIWLREQGFEVATARCNSRVAAQVREFDFVFVNQSRPQSLAFM